MAGLLGAMGPVATGLAAAAAGGTGVHMYHRKKGRKSAGPLRTIAALSEEQQQRQGDIETDYEYDEGGWDASKLAPKAASARFPVSARGGGVVNVDGEGEVATDGNGGRTATALLLSGVLGRGLHSFPFPLNLS
jgi:hypothetical protein